MVILGADAKIKYAPGSQSEQVRQSPLSACVTEKQTVELRSEGYLSAGDICVLISA